MIAVIVPVHGAWERTRDCLESLARHDPGGEWAVIVVDDASPDETPRLAPLLGDSLFGQRFSFLSLPENRGFAAAVNAGAALAGGDWLFLLNNDAVLVEDCITPCVARLREDATLAGAGPLLLYPPGDRLQHGGVAVAHSIKCVHLHHLLPAAHPLVRKERRFQAITAAAMAVSRTRFLELGGLHEGFRNGMEDLDFCFRAAAQGQGFAVLPQVRCLHHEHQSPGRFDREAANARLLRDRHPELPPPDFHRFMAEDGYVPRFTPWLDPYAVPGPEREATITARWKERPDPARLEALLDEEPRWAKGHAMLSGWLEKRGEMAGALQARIRQLAFLPDMAVMEEAIRLARAAGLGGDAPRLASLRQNLDQARTAARRREENRALARHELHRAQTLGDRPLEDTWQAWLAAP